jgi:GNAT superfamily N-acetyltransferase
VSESSTTRILDVTDVQVFGLLPPCADPRFDHRSCDYWEDEARGAKTARPSWWQPGERVAVAPTRPGPADNPFAPPPRELTLNPFAPPPPPAGDPWAALGDTGEALGGPALNPFAPAPRVSSVASDVPRKLRLLARGLAIFGSYAKVLLLDGETAAYAQFGPLSAYPRAQQIRDLYPSLPSAPLPAVITCVSTTAAARGQGLARALVSAVTADLADRGFAAVEAYPDLTLARDQASAAHVRFWLGCGFSMAVDDQRYPVMRIDLD